MDENKHYIELSGKLNEWCRSYLGLQKLSEKTNELYLEVLDKLFKHQYLTPTRYNQYYTRGGRFRAVIKLILNTCEYHDLQIYHYKPIKYKKPKPRKPRIWSKEQIIRMVREIEEYGLLIECAYYIGGGLRFSSAIMLQWTDFLWEEWLENKELAGKCDIFAKGNKEEYLDVDPILMNKLYNKAIKDKKLFQGIPYRNFDGDLYMFFNQSELEQIKKELEKVEQDKVIDLPEEQRFPVNVKLKARNELIEKMHKRVDYRLLKLKKSFDNTKIRFHSIRHSRATHLLEMGFEITDIQKMLMHKDISTTQIYVDVSQKKITNKFNKIVANRKNIKPQ